MRWVLLGERATRDRHASKVSTSCGGVDQIQVCQIGPSKETLLTDEKPSRIDATVCRDQQSWLELAAEVGEGPLRWSLD